MGGTVIFWTVLYRCLPYGIFLFGRETLDLRVVKVPKFPIPRLHDWVPGS